MPGETDAELLALCSAIERDINAAPDMPLMPSLEQVRVLIGAARRAVKMRWFIADYQYVLVVEVKRHGTARMSAELDLERANEQLSRAMAIVEAAEIWAGRYDAGCRNEPGINALADRLSEAVRAKRAAMKGPK